MWGPVEGGPHSTLAFQLPSWVHNESSEKLEERRPVINNVK